MRHVVKNIYKTGQLRVWGADHVPCQEFVYYPVKHSKHGSELIAALAASQLLDPNIEANMFGLERLGPDGEWEEWVDTNGEHIDSWLGIVSENDGNR